MSEVLMFGGSFDPPTRAHVEVAKHAMVLTGGTGVVFVPAFQSPLKSKIKTSPEHRLAMLQLALQKKTWATISTLELERGGTSFTIDTIESLMSDGRRVRLLIGADQWVQFDKWHRHEELLELGNPLVIPRDGIEAPAERLLQVEPMNCSSTEARKAICKDASTDAMLDQAVAMYISQHNLYR